MITTVKCSLNLVRLCRLSNLLNKYSFSGITSRQFSKIDPVWSINKRLLEAREKLPKYPETLSCPQSEKRYYAEQKPVTPNRPTKLGDPCKPLNFTDACAQGKSTDSSSSQEDKSGSDSGRGGSKKWIITLVAVAGCAGIIYFWVLRTFKSDEGSGSSTQLHNCYKIPASSKDIPTNVPYLLIGGGTTCFSAFRAIKSLDPKAKVLVISNELHKPYMRPPLSKELWFHGELDIMPENYKFKQWNGAVRSLYYEPDEFYIDPVKLADSPNGGVAVCQGYEVQKVDFQKQKAILTDGTIINYDKCLIATGCEPKGLDVFQSAPRNVKERVLKYKTPEDFENLKKIAEQKKSIVIVGNGFLSSELSCALAKYVSKIKNPVKIYQIFHENGNIASVLPEYLSHWTTRKVEEQGVCVIPKASVLKASMMHNHLKIDLSNGQSILTDNVVLCTGNEPNTQLGTLSGLDVDKKLGGLIVNSEMEAKKHLYVAGDVASFDDPLLGRRRMESHDHAVVSGRLAGENMTGKNKSYTHQAMFWCDLGPSIGFEGIGLVDASLPTVGVFAKLTPEELAKIKQMSFQKDGSAVEEVVKSHNVVESPVKNDGTGTIKPNDGNEDFEKGVIFYLKDEKIVGILLWNLFNRINIARKVINENKKFEDLNEVAKLFEIHS